MNLVLAQNIVCDISGCNNIAYKKIVYNESQSQGINICKSCLLSLYKEIGKTENVVKNG